MIGLNNRNLFLTILKSVKPKIKIPMNFIPSEGPLPSLQTATFSLYPHIERERTLFLLSYKVTNPMMKAPLTDLI